MSDRGPLYDQKDTPEDVATLYSWANLHGAKYRDFSESRAQTREKARQRVQLAIEGEQARLLQQAQVEPTADVLQMPEFSRVEEQDSQAHWAAEQAAQFAADQEATQQAAIRLETAEREAAILDAAGHATVSEEAELQVPRQAEIDEQAQMARQTQEENELQSKTHVVPQEPVWNPLADRFANFVTSDVELYAEPPVVQPPVEFAAQPTAQWDTAQNEIPTYVPPQTSWPGMGSAQPAAYDEPAAIAPPSPKNEGFEHPTSSWGQGFSAPQEQRETPARPAWLTPEPVEAPSSDKAARPADDSLQGSRDRLASRWYALRGVFDGANVQPEVAPAAPTVRPPVVAVFSLAGGVGKTSLSATLGRALSSRGERVLIIDTAPYGLMPFFFGAHDQRPGVLRTFNPPGTSVDAPVQMITIDPENLGPETPTVEVMSDEISKYSRGVSRIIVDLATASGATTRRVLRMSPLVLVPMVPDMNSVVSVSSIDSFFQHNINPNAKLVMPYFILNQFDSSLPLHLDVREILREQLGDRLLTLSIRRTPAVSEALAEGMTVVDYAPNSTVAEDFANLAGWVKSQSAPASNAVRGVRWSER